MNQKENYVFLVQDLQKKPIIHCHYYQPGYPILSTSI